MLRSCVVQFFSFFLETDSESSSVFLCSSFTSVRLPESGDSWIPISRGEDACISY